MANKPRYLDVIAGVERPGRYIGGELGLPAAMTSPRLRFVMGFPDVYEVGMSHLGFRLIHAELLAREDLQVERVFLPWPDLQAQLRRHRLPLCTLESQIPVKSFDVLGLSLQYELSTPSVLKLLDLSQIPRRTRDRAQRAEQMPLVLVGGAGALNPEPLSPFVDCFFLGEADRAVHQIVDMVVEHRARGGPREALLEDLGKIEGIYIPEQVEMTYPGGLTGLGVQPVSRPNPVRRRYVEDLDDLPVPPVHLVPLCHVVHDRVTVELQRGCSHGCRFCQAGFVSRPTRQRSANRVLELARQQLQATGYQALSLLSLSAGDHPCLQQLLAALIEEHGRDRVAISLPSLRTESLHPSVAQQIGRVRRTTFTLAPEAATDRLRRVINKSNTEEDLIDAVRGVVRAGYSQVKLYYMIGLPTETDEEVCAIAELSRRVLDEMRRIRSGVRLTVAVSTFVPKPHTPFQWEASPMLQEIQRKQRLLQRHGGLPRQVRVKWHDPGQSVAESILSRADRRMAGVLERLVTPDYPALDAWTEHFVLERWEEALAASHAAGEIPDPISLQGPRDPGAPLPWDHLDVGVTRDYLLAQRRAALSQRVRPDCSDGTCDACGVCPDEPLHRLAPEVSFAGEAVSEARVQDEGESKSTLRLWFSKAGRARLVSHLEMASTFVRAARRARLPLAYSAGFHPKPRLAFSPALPLGAESRCEFLELRLRGELPLEEVRGRLQEQLPAGFTVERAEAAERSLLGRIRGIVWWFVVRCLAGDQSLEETWQRLMASPMLQRRGGGKTFDMRERIIEVRVLDPERFELRCRMDERGTLRPAEVLARLGLPEPWGALASCTRVDWLLEEGD